MSSCRESDHADFFRINLPSGSISADNSHGFLGILKGTNRFIGHDPVRREPVFKNYPGYSVVIQPLCDSVPLVIEGKGSISASGTYQNCSAVGFGRIGKKNSEIGSDNISGTCNSAVGGNNVFYIGRIIFRSGNAVGPEFQDFWLRNEINGQKSG